MAMAMDEKGFVRFSRGSGAGMIAREFAWDDRELKARMQHLRQNMGLVLRTGIEQINALVAVRVEETSPRDTNRFVRGWLMACGDVGPIPAMIPGVVASARHQQYLAYLEKEANRVGRILKATQAKMDFWYTSKPNRNRNTPAYNQLQREIAKLERWHNRIIEEYVKLDGDPSGLLMDKERGQRNYSTVRVGTYGGSGIIAEQSDRVTVVYHNKEPHTTIVEKRYGVMTRALREVKTLGTTRANAAMIKRIKQVDQSRAA